MFVLNNCTNDSRVLKEAKSLVDGGYEVKIIATLDDTVKPLEQREGFIIVRVPKGPQVFKSLGVILKGFVSSLLRRESATSRKKGKSILQVFKDSYRQFGFELGSLGLFGYVRENFKKAPVRFIILGWAGLTGYYFLKAISITLWLTRRILKRTFFFFFRPLFLAYSFYYYRALKVVGKDPADIYHSNDLNTLVPGFLAKKFYGGKLVYDSHELYLERNTFKKQSRISKVVLKFIESTLIKRTDANITVNDSVAGELSKRYGVKKPYVVRNAPKFNNVKKSNLLRNNIERITSKNKIILYSGVITFNRGLEELISSLHYIDNVSLVLMGYGHEDYISQLKKHINREHLSSRVFFFGPVAPELVTKYAASADIGAAPIKNSCLSYYYCSPNKVFEYIGAGLPVVGSDFPEIRKIINSYKLGKTFKPDDPKDIAKAITEVLSDVREYKTMVQNSLMAAKQFNWENEEKKFMKIYSSLS